MKKIILLLVLATTGAMADTAYEYFVSNPTMAQAYFDIFNAITALMQSSAYFSILKLIFSLGVFFVFINGIMKLMGGGDSKSAIVDTTKYLIAGSALLLLILPTNDNRATLLVQSEIIPTSYCSDANNYSAFSVSMNENVAMFFATMNDIGRSSTALAATAFSSVSATPEIGDSFSAISNKQFGAGIRSSQDLLKINFTEDISPTYAAATQTSANYGIIANGDILKYYMNDFMQQCVYMSSSPNSAMGTKILTAISKTANIKKTLNNLFSSDLLDTFKDSAGSGLYSSVALTGNTRPSTLLFEISDTTGNVSYGTCKQFWEQAIKPALDGIAQNDIMCHRTDISPAGMYLMTGNNNSATPAVASEIAINQALISMSRESSDIPLVKDQAYAAGKSQAEFITQNTGTGAYMAEMLPYLQMGIRAVLYAFFPFVFLVMLLPGGLNVMKNYAQTLIWVELWSPVAAILNLFLSYFQMDKMSKTYDIGLNAVNSSDLVTDASMLASVAGYLYMSVPALTYLVLKGSAQMLGSISGGMSAGFAKNMDSNSIRNDMSQIEKSKELNKTTGKNNSMSENLMQLENLSAGIEGASIGKAIANSGGVEAYREGMSDSKAMEDTKKIAYAGNSSFNIQKAMGSGNAYQEIATLTSTGALKADGSIDEEKVKEVEAAVGIEKAGDIRATVKNMSHIAKQTLADLSTVKGKQEVANVMANSKSSKFKGGVAEQASKATQYALDNGLKINGKNPNEATFKETMAFAATAEIDMGAQKGKDVSLNNEKNEAVSMKQGRASKVINNVKDIEKYTGQKMTESKTVKDNNGNEFLIARTESGAVYTAQKGARALRGVVGTNGTGAKSKEAYNNLSNGKDITAMSGSKVQSSGAINELTANAANKELIERKTDTMTRNNLKVDDIATQKVVTLSQGISNMKETTNNVFANDSKKVNMDIVNGEGNVQKTNLQENAVRDTLDLANPSLSNKELEAETQKIMQSGNVNEALNDYAKDNNISESDMNKAKTLSAQVQTGKLKASNELWNQKSSASYRKQLADKGYDSYVEATNRAFRTGQESVIPEAAKNLLGVDAVDAGKGMGAMTAMNVGLGAIDKTGRIGAKLSRMSVNSFKGTKKGVGKVVKKVKEKSTKKMTQAKKNSNLNLSGLNKPNNTIVKPNMSKKSLSSQLGQKK